MLRSCALHEDKGTNTVMILVKQQEYFSGLTLSIHRHHHTHKYNEHLNTQNYDQHTDTKTYSKFYHDWEPGPNLGLSICDSTLSNH